MFFDRYSQAAALLGDVVYLFGGATSSEEQTLYHGDMFALDCKLVHTIYSTVPFTVM